MEKPYRELARLVGRVLAKRWLNKTAKEDVRHDSHSKASKASPRGELAGDITDGDKRAPA